FLALLGGGPANIPLETSNILYTWQDVGGQKIEKKGGIQTGKQDRDIYPQGSSVELSYGQAGVIVKNEKIDVQHGANKKRVNTKVLILQPQHQEQQGSNNQMVFMSAGIKGEITEKPCRAIE